MLKLIVFFITCVLYISATPKVKIQYSEEKHKFSDEKFIPTKHWQTVKQDQAIPPGLHVRLNLETGSKEAKLIDEHDEQSGYNQIINLPESEDSKLKNGEYLKNLVKNKKLRSMDELKKDMNKMNLNYKSDAEILKELFSEYSHVTGLEKENHIGILNELDSYLHQVDNGQEWLRIGGMQLLIRDINSTDDDISKTAALCFSGAVQSNPKVQVAVLSSLPILVRRIISSTNEQVSSRILSAISSLVRHFPAGLYTFVSKGGLDELEKLLKSNISLNFQKKIVTFLTDIHNECVTSVDMQKNKQVEEIYQNILSQLNVYNWCVYFWKLLKINDHDSREKIAQSLKTFSCTATNILDISELKVIRDNYMKLGFEHAEDINGYFTNLAKLYSELLDNQLNSKSEL